MEGRESMGLPPSSATTAGSDSFPAVSQRVGHVSGGLHVGMAPAIRPHSSVGVTIAANPNNSSSPPYHTDPSTAIVAHGINASMSTGLQRMEPGKRKRGRPRKYGPDGSMALALTPISSTSNFSPSEKRGRGRPPGSGKKQQLAALGSAGVGFTPHVITIASGEDVASKIMSFSQQGPRAVCILSANGAVSNVTLRQSAISGGTVTYEGRFEILSLSGSFLLTENGGTRSRTGGLSVSLAGPDGRVLGGGVAGLLMAASPVQVVVGSFISNGRKPQSKPANPEPSGGLGKAAASGGVTVASPVSRGTMSESSGGPSSPMNQSTGDFNSASTQPIQNMASYQSAGWQGPPSMAEPKRNTDINMPLPGG
ncbi:AT-hook motif nuclear-localized protein 10 isoform X2 [Cryptomeria japonica]|uniref:AT-hook motif nuclear-localized protein 10 isoform X2 n=1 Tax=Cryptomeria japonica TaxID=3369 RepID=UPI0025AD4FAF|nr:AT-hook motif nuclear-localized protein 10 isoform X2 [Cryptomeria japonica]